MYLHIYINFDEQKGEKNVNNNQWHKVLFEAIKKSEHVVLCVPLQLNYNRNQNYAGKNSILPNRYSKGELTIYRMRKKKSSEHNNCTHTSE